MIIDAGFAQANLIWSWPTSGQRAECTLGLTLPSTPPTPEDAAQSVLDSYDAAAMAQIQTGVITLVGVHVKFGPNDTGGAFDLPADIDGTLSGNSVTPNVTLLVKKLTTAGGRAGRGRFYWPGIQEGVVNDYGVLDSGAKDTFQGLFDDFRSSLLGFDLIPTLLHNSAETPDAITAFEVQTLVATQRRRLGR